MITMPKGGARTRSGPAPDPNALRRDRPSDASEWIVLPAEGRVGAAPEWPLAEPAERELVIWSQLWVKPQAVAWEQLGVNHEVALYVRRLCEAEQHGAPATLSTLVRQLGDSLGISIPGMRANRWRIADPASGEVRRPAARRTAARDRFKVVPNDGA
jgi:hypothetical protein